MYCENCGNQLQESDKFCTKCGTVIHYNQQHKEILENRVSLSDKLWYRFLKVVYIILYAFVLLILPIVWSASSSYYDYRSSSTVDTSGTAFWYCILAFIIYVAIIRLIKIAVLYIAIGYKPVWKEEFKKLY